MSEYRTKHNVFISAIIVLAALIVTLPGCTDEITTPPEVQEGEVELRGKVTFRPLMKTEVKTRSDKEASGPDFRDIESLYLFFFDSERKYVPEYTGYVREFERVPSDATTQEHVEFRKNVKAGRYYIFAVANISDEDRAAFESLRTIEALRDFRVHWSDNIADDLEMFGVFSLDDGTNASPTLDAAEEDKLLAITPSTNKIHSWVRRVTSKITVDFDGKKLMDGVTVYIKKATIVDAPNAVRLANPSSVDGRASEENGIGFAKPEGYSYSIIYGNGDNHTDWKSVVSNKGSFKPADVWEEDPEATFHDDDAKALPCYENLQGEPEGKNKYQHINDNGTIDYFEKDGVDNGTYLEVEGYYVSDRPEYKSQGIIRYRFMLGTDAEKNFDLIRNYHYKITMQFRDYGNDVDWHIVYTDRYFDATYPKDVDWRGKFFEPTSAYDTNGGHTFNNLNEVYVSSFETDGKKKNWIDPEISYFYSYYDEESESWIPDNNAGWISVGSPESIEGDDSQKKYTFVASKEDVDVMHIDDRILGDNGYGPSSPQNLSNEDGNSTVIMNTANCYMVGAKGWYCFPLVYGNAVTGGITRSEAYSSDNIRNHLDKKITGPYIKDNVDLSGLTGGSAKLIWQDADGLIDQIIYDPELFEVDGVKKGGIKFHVGAKKEGNAVIALIDPDDTNILQKDLVTFDRGEPYGQSGSTKAIWSWHIWVTRFGFDFKDVCIHNRKEQAFDVMPVNLGWCAGSKGIKYYKPRKCVIKIKSGENELLREIYQHPHLILPRGNHPYYQWGRKDPFVGTDRAYGNKPRWDGNGKYYGDEGKYNPPRVYVDPKQYSKDEGRKHTKDCIAVLVQNPDKWHNAPREPVNPDDFNSGFFSINEAPGDLWSTSGGYKTVYDPCPAGYQIADLSVFTGLTTTGEDAYDPKTWYDVLEDNMDYPDDFHTGWSINSQVIEFYTDPGKLRSITFPISGYRDYDSKAEVVQFQYEGGNVKTNGIGYVWFNVQNNVTKSHHLKFQRFDMEGTDWEKRTAIGTDGSAISSVISVTKETFNNTDGFGVRPVKITKKP